MYMCKYFDNADVVMVVGVYGDNVTHVCSISM